jgi:tRNA(Arg) A34 adenosine deaminase TadA
MFNARFCDGIYVVPGGSSHRLVAAAGKYAEIAVKEAESAKSDGTFGVGGLLIGGDNGKIYKVIRNAVIRGNSVRDPTAHVERQLVDWYFSKKKKKKTNSSLPPAGKMTIITSLDPCAMCSGAILSGGFNVIHISRDAQAGISCRGLGDFTTLPDGLAQRARETFSAFGVIGDRPFIGSPESIFSGDEIDSELDRRSTRAFSSSLKKVKGIINSHHGQLPDKLLTDPRTLARSSRIFRLLRKYNPKVFSDGYVVDFDRPGINLGYILVEKAKESHEKSGTFNSACLIDPFGNILLSEGSNEGASPIRTPFLELVRKYHNLLFEAGAEGRKYLAHLKYCKTVMLLGPGYDSKSLMEVGCFGSSMEGKLPKGRQIQYVIQQQGQDDLQNMLDNLPPLYSDVMRKGDAIQQVEDVQLQQFCTGKATLFASGHA